jgi:MFS family permease
MVVSLVEVEGQGRTMGDGLAVRVKRAVPAGVVRTLVAAVAADSIGQGLLISMTTFYLLRVVGLTAAEVGIGLTVAAVLAVLVSTPIGYAADRWNPLSVNVAMNILRAVAILGFLVIRDLPTFLVVVPLYATTNAAVLVTGAAMLPTVMPAERRVRTRATTRVTSNIGVTVGVGLGGLAIGIESATTYRLLFVLTAAGALVSTYFFNRLHRFQLPRELGQTPAERSADDAEAAAEVTPAQVLRDRPYLTLTVISSLMAINDGLLIVALPLWISESTNAPLWIYSVAVALNTAGVILFQIPFSRLSNTVTGAGRALRIAGVTLAAGCLLWATAGETDTRWLVIALIMCGSVAHVVGEIMTASGGWGVSYELAPEHAHGQYQGVFGMGQQITNAVVPFVAGVFLVHNGLGGWALVAGVLLVAGLCAPAVVSWALRTPPRTAPEPVTG